MRTILVSFALLLSAVSTAQTINSSPVQETANSHLTSETSPLQSIRGNWFRADNPNQWEYGIYDSISIIQNRIFTNRSIRKQDDCIELTVQNKKNTAIETLRFTPQANGDYLIKFKEGNELLYTKEAVNEPLTTTEADFKEFIRKDTAYLQGYIDRYNPETASTTLLMGNELTSESHPTVVNINPDGSFECKLILNYPIENLLSLGNHYISFYIEPGQTLSIYVDNEGSYDNIKMMGPSAALSQMYDKLNDLIRYDNDVYTKAKNGFSPDLFKLEIQTESIRLNQLGDSLAQIYATSSKAVHLIKNKLALEKGKILLNFMAYRSLFAERDTANQALKMKVGNNYYDFLKDISLNDESLLADKGYREFINRFEFMPLLREIQSDAYEKKFLSPSTSKETVNVSGRKQDIQALDKTKEYLVKGDSVIRQLSGQANSFLWQTTLVRRLQFDLKAYNTFSVAKKHINILNKYLTYPILVAETNRIFDTVFSKKADKTYQLPEGKATEIFRNIIKAHSGKMLFIDFWATSCGGCRQGIEATAQLRKDYKNHPEFQFIYITDERSSPKKTYDEYVAKNLKGEVSYRISESEFEYLRELFKFNGIPHYELIQKNGSVTVNSPTAWELEEYILKHFKKSNEL
ncbi:TlpA family protein disulfide reductase [Bacteroides acidifaciens]|uniref:TlpA family protein disulfide reductase n=1 Tax=Bacteroides acidifaciens TaxID=85831 RepID=UPI00158E9EA7|nr:thioredoxin family protein [Bacteroides acidifaciens]